MSQKKDGPRHGTSVRSFLPGMTSRSDTVQRYTAGDSPYITTNISNDPTVADRYARMAGPDAKRRVKQKKRPKR